MPASPRPDQHAGVPASPTVVVILLGLAALVVSALDLGAFGLRHYLTSDFLTPFFFCRDLLDRHYPISGWTLSASPYFVPDHLLLSALLAAFGRDGLGYALYTPVFYPALFLLAGGCIRTVVGRTGPALVAGLVFGNILLAARLLPGHAQRLWWLGAPTCHGGVLLLGFAVLWGLGAGLRRGTVGWPAVAFSGVLGFVGLLSDSLFLFQVTVPATVALFVLRRRHAACARWLRWQVGSSVAAVAVAQLFKPICRFEGWFYFSRILRVAPTPANQWHAFCRFVADVPTLLRDGWCFALVALVATAVLSASLRRMWRRSPMTESVQDEPGRAGREFLRVFCAASLLIMLPLPILTCAWKDVNNLRYLLNWLVLPGFLLTLEATAAWCAHLSIASSLRERWVSRGLAAGALTIFALNLGVSANALTHEDLRFPYPDDVAALDAIVRERGLKYGLAQYWDAKLVTALSHSGLELRQVRSSGEPYFWDNNAAAYFERRADGQWSWPAYRFVLTDLLDEAAIAQAYGEPVAKETAGHYRLWIYGDEGAARMRSSLEPAIREKLGSRFANPR